MKRKQKKIYKIAYSAEEKFNALKYGNLQQKNL